MNALCVLKRSLCLFKWWWFIFGTSSRYWASFVFSRYFLFQIFRDRSRIKFIRVIILWCRRFDDNKEKLCTFSVILSIISLFLMSACSEIQCSVKWASRLRILFVIVWTCCNFFWSCINDMTWITFNETWLSK